MCLAFRDGSIIYYKRYFSKKKHLAVVSIGLELWIFDRLLVTPQKKKSCSISTLHGFLNSKAETVVSDPESQAKMQYESESLILQVIYLKDRSFLNKCGTIIQNGHSALHSIFTFGSSLVWNAVDHFIVNYSCEYLVWVQHIMKPRILAKEEDD